MTREDIPEGRHEHMPVLEKFEVAAGIKKFRKPKSMVKGDIFPELMTLFSDFLVIPLTGIYNTITTTYEWPACWKLEFVTLIPKRSHPESLNDMRNISCAMLASKIYESFILQWAKDQVKLKSNQFGRVKGRGTEHMLVTVMQRVLQDLEDYYRAGSV